MNINLLVFGAGIFDFIGGLSKYLNPLEWVSLFLMGIRSILFFFDQTIYEFIITLYNIFRLLCSARIGSDGIAGELATRIGLILGLVMFFYVTFDFIQILIDPDKINDKEKGPLNIIKKFIIVIVLLGTSSFIFNYLHRFQTAVLSADDKGTSVLERLILPYNINTDNFGRAIASNFMMEFYKMTDDPEASSATAVDEDFTYEVCSKNAKEFPGRIAATGSLYSGTFCLNARYKTEDGSRFYIDFSPLSIVVGAFVVVMLFMYCISVGMRVAQLAVLEIISPVAFVSYLSPKKDGMFGKFWKIYFSTYIDVFLRIAIINFVVLLTGLILDSNNSGKDFWTSVGNPTGSTRRWISIFMILALLSFAKKFPDLIKKFLPESASGLSLGISAKDRAGIGIVGGALTGIGLAGVNLGRKTITGAATGGPLGALGGFASGLAGLGTGAVRGAVQGGKGKDLRESLSNARKRQAEVNLRSAQNQGVRFRERASNSLGGFFGVPAGGVADTADINTLNEYTSLQENIENYADNNSDVKAMKRAFEYIQQSGRGKVADTDARGNVVYRDETDDEFTARLDSARERYKDAQHAFVEAVTSGESSFEYVNTKGETVTSKSFDSDDFNVSNVKSAVEKRDTIKNKNKTLFRDYKEESSWENIDNNTNRARNQSVILTNNRRKENKSN